MTSAGGYTDTVRRTRCLWSMVGPFAAGLLGLVVLGSGSVAAAQASALGNPYGPDDGVHAPVVVEPVTTVPATAAPTATPPPTYGDVSVPTPPPGSSIYPAPRVGLLADNPNVHIGTTTATRLRALDADLQILAARGGGNFLDGVLMLVSAAATTTWAVLLDTSGAPGVISYAAVYLYMYAGASVGRAILSFALMTNPSAPAIRYSHMPMGSMHEVRERLRYGELQLEGLADQARIQRILDGSINLAIGLAVIPTYLGPNNFQVPNPADWFVLVLAGVSAVMGVVSLVTTTEAERRESAYHELRDRILATPEGLEDEDALEREAATQAASAVSFTPVMSFGPTGGFAGATVTF
jgi:hypothetical protein